jgi:hypothetical protein
MKEINEKRRWTTETTAKSCACHTTSRFPGYLYRYFPMLPIKNQNASRREPNGNKKKKETKKTKGWTKTKATSRMYCADKRRGCVRDRERGFCG